MNERIRELAEQAGIEFDDDFPLEPETIYYLKLSDFKKFAQLIVKECMNAIYDIDDLGGYHFKAVNAVKQHFGVEE